MTYEFTSGGVISIRESRAAYREDGCARNSHFFQCRLCTRRRCASVVGMNGLELGQEEFNDVFINKFFLEINITEEKTES